MTPILVSSVMIVDMLRVLLMSVHALHLVMCVLVLDPWETIAFLLRVALVLLLELFFRDRLPRMFQVFLIRTGICIMLTHVISWVLLLSM